MAISLIGQAIIPGTAEGQALVSQEPLSFWGGYDYHTGTIIDKRHPLAGAHATGCMLALPFTRGSSTTTAVLLEAIRAGTAPAAIISNAPDSFFTLASIVADEMYGQPLPLIVLAPKDFNTLQTGQRLRLHADGRLEILS
jgi:predicted aconitase with swiveling domain